MAEAMTFLPRSEVLTIEELAEVADAFIARGVRKVRLTGGEPLVRRGVLQLAETLGARIGDGLDELTLTTNGTNLARHADALRAAGIRRINVSLDTLDADRFRHITRWGDLAPVMAGIAAATRAGIAIKINMVALKGVNEDEIVPMLRWCGAEGHGLTLIETMPLGAVDEDRTDRFLPLDGVRRDLEAQFTLTPVAHRTGGPARYVRVEEPGVTLGLITPMTANFCDGCNRVRVSASGRLYPCLGHDDRVDLKAALRGGGRIMLDEALDEAMMMKPRAHDFRIGGASTTPATVRHMSVTGG